MTDYIDKIAPEPRRSLREIIEDAMRGEPSVYLVRHGATEMNRGGSGKDLIRGWKDVPLSKEGLADAHRLAADLKDCDFKIIHCSDLQRAEITAEIIAKTTGGEVESAHDLRSWNMGPEFEGKLTSKPIIKRIKELVEGRDERARDGESFLDFVHRIIEAVEPVFKGARGETAIVTHGRCLQIIALWVASGCDEDAMLDEYEGELESEPDSIAPGGYLELKRIDGKWTAAKEESHQKTDKSAVVS